MSTSGKASQKNPGGTNVETLIVVEQRPFWVPNTVLSSFLAFQNFVKNQSPFGANVPPSSEQTHWTTVAALVGVTMGN